MDEFNKPYNPKDYEDEIYKKWEDSGYFNPDKLPGERKETFSIAMAPPNVTGSLHMGHALEYTLSDILVRFKRMRGFETLWLPGTDHAGIATQNVVEKELKKQGVSRHDLGREKFLEKVWEWREKYGGVIIDQLKKLGASADWSRLRFTMDAPYAEAVKTAFEHYYKKGWIYEGERVINWCPRCATSLSDLEVEYKEEESELIYIKYPLVEAEDGVEHITVATVRPETMLGDAAVAVNPQDERYKKLIGRRVVLPIQNREIPVIGDEAVDMEFGTGAVKVTPAHDPADFGIAERHNLEVYKIIDEKGRMTETAKLCVGLKVGECRTEIIKELEKLGLVEKKEKYVHNISKCYRCDSVIEPLLSKQWFLKMKELAQKAKTEVASGRIKFHPENFAKTYLDWLDNIRDWTISRQIWWGHKIPLAGMDDVLDTWFSSALWPLAALGWPQKTKDLEKFYPTNVLTNDRGIINLWDTRMIFSGLEFMNEKPFSDLIIHATVMTREGKRMSKSLGTGIDPLQLIDKYGADAVRFALVWQALGGQDIKWQEEAVMAGKKFLNKIWNASRFVLQRKGMSEMEIPVSKPETKEEINTEILKKLETAKKTVTGLVENYEIGQALHTCYEFFWHEFCDVYLEQAKKSNSEETSRTLLYVLAESLKMAHPFIPFATETIWGKLPQGDKKLLMVEPW